MSEVNPYQAPASDINTDPGQINLDQKAFNHLATGQKMIIYALIFWVIIALVPLFGISDLHPAITLSLFICTATGFIGQIRIISASQTGWFKKLWLVLAIFVPVVGLFIINHLIATRELRSAGYKVGVFGVKGSYKYQVI